MGNGQMGNGQMGNSGAMGNSGNRYVVTMGNGVGIKKLHRYLGKMATKDAEFVVV